MKHLPLFRRAEHRDPLLSLSLLPTRDGAHSWSRHALVPALLCVPALPFDRPSPAAAPVVSTRPPLPGTSPSPARRAGWQQHRALACVAPPNVPPVLPAMKSPLSCESARSRPSGLAAAAHLRLSARRAPGARYLSPPRPHTHAPCSRRQTPAPLSRAPDPPTLVPPVLHLPACPHGPLGHHQRRRRRGQRPPPRGDRAGLPECVLLSLAPRPLLLHEADGLPLVCRCSRHDHRPEVRGLLSSLNRAWWVNRARGAAADQRRACPFSLLDLACRTDSDAMLLGPSSLPARRLGLSSGSLTTPYLLLGSATQLAYRPPAATTSTTRTRRLLRSRTGSRGSRARRPACSA